MLDKDGIEILTGDLVLIEGGYFKADNGLFRVERSPGDAGWLGSDYSLRKAKKDGSPSNCKYDIAFWPLMVTTNSYEKRVNAKAHNKLHATIEVVRRAGE